MKIVTLTINPALDKATSTTSLVPEKKLRCKPLSIEAGGGGINVSKGLLKLGTLSTAIFPVGGYHGKILAKLVKEQGIRAKTVEVIAETRESLAVTDEHSGFQYRFTMPGAPMSAQESTALLDLLENMQPEIIVASGSLPDGVGDDFYAKVADIAHRISARLVLDCSGQPLLQATKRGVYLLKPNLNELSQLVGVPELALDQVDDAARQLIAQGKVEVIVVSLGGQGAVLVTKDRLEHIPVPLVKVKTTVGAGDSMVAGMVWALNRKAGLGEMVRMGVACGTAATLNSGTQLFIAEDAWKMLDWIKANAARYRFTDF